MLIDLKRLLEIKKRKKKKRDEEMLTTMFRIYFGCQYNLVKNLMIPFYTYTLKGHTKGTALQTLCFDGIFFYYTHHFESIKIKSIKIVSFVAQAYVNITIRLCIYHH